MRQFGEFEATFSSYFGGLEFIDDVNKLSTECCHFVSVWPTSLTVRQLGLLQAVSPGVCEWADPMVGQNICRWLRYI